MTRSRLLLCAIAAAALFAAGPSWGQTANLGGGAPPAHYLSAASNNSTSIKASQGTLYSIVAINMTTTLYYLRIYDVAVAPTCSSATGVVANIPIPFGATNAGGGVSIPLSVGMYMANGIGFCLTAGGADNDNTNAATGVYLNFTFK